MESNIRWLLQTSISICYISSRFLDALIAQRREEEARQERINQHAARIQAVIRQEELEEEE